MAKRFLLLVLGIGLIGASRIRLDRLFGVLNWYEDVPFPTGPWSWFVAAQSGLLLLGAAALAMALLPRLRTAVIAGIAVLAAGGVTMLRHPQVYPTIAFNSLHRMTFWRNGSELFTAPPEYLAWADDFAEWLEARPAQAKLAYSVFLRLGDYNLRIGNAQPAITYFEKALASIEQHQEELEREREGAYLRRRAEMLRWLSVAHLRAGERDNCIKQKNADACIYPLQGGGLWTLREHAIAARKYLDELLELDPANAGARYMLNLAHMAVGNHPEGVPEQFRLPAEPAEPAVGMPHFRNVAYAVGVAHDSIAGGAIMDDFDGDGDLDLFATCLRQDTNCVYYRNEGDGRFTDATDAAGLRGVTGGLSTSQADVDNDGDLDILIPRGAWLGDLGRIPNVLLLNDGKGNFTDVSAASGIADPAYPCLAAAWCDYDLDGDLDLYVGNERLHGEVHAPSQLLRNDGTGKFTDVAKAAGVENLRYARGVCWGDYDNDGDFDLYVSNFGALNRLYRNRGDGTFEDVAEPLGVAHQHPDPKRQRTFQSWFFDFDNDGWLDIFSASYPLTAGGGNVDYHALGMFLERAVEETCKLWINDRQGGFRDVSTAAGLDRTVFVMGANIADLDADGWTDLYLATGAPAFEVLVPNTMLRNLGGKQVADVTAASGLGHVQKGHGVAFGDIDHDGDIDAWVNMGGWYADDFYYKALFRNDAARGAHWLTLRLRGERSNHFGVGAVVAAIVREDGAERAIRAIAGSGASFGANSLDVDLGLGRATELLRVEIVWPRAGSIAERTQILSDLPMNRMLEVREDGGWTDVTPAPIPLAPELR